MSAVLVNVETGASPSADRKKPKLIFRGRRRHAVVKLQKAVQLCLRQDDAENVRSANKGYDPYLLLPSGNKSLMECADRIDEACSRALKAKG